MLKEQVAEILLPLIVDTDKRRRAKMRILNLFKALLDKLTVIERDVIDDAFESWADYGEDEYQKEGAKQVAHDQLQHTKKQLLDLMGE